MKTTINLLTVFFMMGVTLLYAGDPKYITIKVDVNFSSTSARHAELAPVTPKEAGFNDNVFLPTLAITPLAPITPKEATFEDLDSENGGLDIPDLLQKIAPDTPTEAGFEDSVPESSAGILSLAPVTPEFAGFDE